uniref:Protein hairy n=1 Tax=Cacopsylla melanoneura TaxID=428564 RepID=A0A8D8XYK2_9HEMI
MVTMTAETSIVSNSPTPPSVDSTARKTNENRRSNKPIMEKRRRARINNCLNELKTLILDAMKKDPARHSKLEKADILEMTVKHLENMQRQQLALSAATDPNVLNKFRAGFSECTGEVGRFPGLDPSVRRRLLTHLSNCLNSNNEPTATSPEPRLSPAPVAPAPQSGLQVHIVPQQTPTESAQPQVQNSNGIFLSSGAQSVQLVPTRLPNGDIALVLPSNNTPRQMAASPSSSSSSSTSPLPMLVPIPNRPVPTSNRTSPIGFERLSVSIPQQETLVSPVDPSHYRYSSPDQSPSDYSYRSPSPLQKPLSLVMKKSYEPCYDDERPWRPW